MAAISPLGFEPAAWLHMPDSEENSTPNNSGSDSGTKSMWRMRDVGHLPMAMRAIRLRTDLCRLISR